jgi:hypothetical protein
MDFVRLEMNQFKTEGSLHIADFMSDARQYAATNSVVVEFVWRALIRVSKDTNIVDLYRDWETSEYMNWSVVGPTTAPYSRELENQIRQRKLLSDHYCLWTELSIGGVPYNSGQFGLKTIIGGFRSWLYHFGINQPRNLLPNPAL